MNKKRTTKRRGNSNWRNTRSTLKRTVRPTLRNREPELPSFRLEMTQKGWNAAAILGIAAVLFNFALLKKIQTRVIMIALGVFWTLFCLFRVVRLFTGLVLGVSLSVFSFYGTTVVISDSENASVGVGFCFVLFACGIYIMVYFAKKLISYLKELRKQSKKLTADTADLWAEPEAEIPVKSSDGQVASLTKDAAALSDSANRRMEIINRTEEARRRAHFALASEISIQNPRTGTYPDTYDELFPAAVDIVLEAGQATTSMIQRRLKLGYSRASHLIDEMERMGYIEPFNGGRPRQVLITHEQWAQMRGHIRYAPSKPTISTDQIVRDEEIWRQEKSGLSPMEYELQKVDGMEGHAFEEWCADLLKKNGFYSIKVTPGSGDQGVDITATKDGLTYAIQCKRYASDLGNTPVQEVAAGKAFYHCNVAAVMTNQHFTSGAKELAKVNGVLLWDRETIIDMLKSGNSSLEAH